MKFGLKKATVIVAAIAVIAASVGIARQFYPSSRYELSGGGKNRLFSVSVDSADGSVPVRAADWPYTFSRPFTLGDSYWPEKYSTIEFYWSNDRTVVAMLAQEKGDAAPLYFAAYDYRSHKGVDLQSLGWVKSACNEQIAALLRERGGRDDSPIAIPSPNSGSY